MSIQPGAVAPVVPGEVITPAAVLDPVSVPSHNFFNTLREFLRLSNVYRNEVDLHSALDSIDAYEARVVPNQDKRYLPTEDDPAGREDVSQRVAPVAGGVAAVPGPQIDYNKLAAALIAAQQQAQAENPPPAPVQPPAQSPTFGA